MKAASDGHTRAHEKWGPPSGSRPFRSCTAMKLARLWVAQDEPPFAVPELVFLGQFFKQSLIYSFISCHCRFLSPNGSFHLMGWATRPVIYLEWKSATASFPPDPSNPARRSSSAEWPYISRPFRCCPDGMGESGKRRSYSNPEFPFQLPTSASFVILNCGAAASSDSLSRLGRSPPSSVGRRKPNNGALASG